MSLSIIFPGIEKTFNQFIEELLDDDFDTFFKMNTENFNRKKEKIFEYFIYEFLIKNGITAEINMTFISFSKDIFRTLSDGNTDIHGKFCKYILLNIGLIYKLRYSRMRNRLTVSRGLTCLITHVNINICDDAIMYLQNFFLL